MSVTHRVINGSDTQSLMTVTHRVINDHDTQSD